MCWLLIGLTDCISQSDCENLKGCLIKAGPLKAGALKAVKDSATPCGPAWPCPGVPIGLLLVVVVVINGLQGKDGGFRQRGFN